MKLKINYYLTSIFLLAGFIFITGFILNTKQAYAFNPLYFTAAQNGPLPVAQDSRGGGNAATITITNNTLTNGEVMYWFLSSDVSWLSASQTCRGTTGCSFTSYLIAGASDTVTILPNTSNMAIGNYVGTVTINGYVDPGKTTASTPASQTITVNYTVSPPCTSNPMTSTPATSPASPIPWNSSATLNFSSNNCTSATLTGGQYGSAPGTSEPVNGTASTGALTSTTTFTFTPCGPAGCASPVSQTVNVGAQPCYIAVASTYNGAAGTLPPSGFNYTISGPSTISGSNTTGASPWAVTAGTSWTFSATPVSGSVTLQSVTPNTNQSCVSSGSTTTFTANFADNPPGAPGGTTVQNTSINSAVVCGHVKLSWTASAGATNYYLYRSTSSSNPTLGGNPWVDAGNVLTYDYIPPITDPPYFYWVAAHNGGGTSSPPTGPASPGTAVAPSPCNSDFGVSNKVMTKINGLNVPFNSPAGCIGNQAGTMPKTIRVGDKISWSLNICNQGNQDATNVVVTDILTNLMPASPANYTLTTSPPSASAPITPTLTGTCATGTCTLQFNVGNVSKGTNAVITFDTITLVPVGSTQTLNRFRNQASFTFGSSGTSGCIGTGTTSANPCVLNDPGYIIFYNGAKAPNQTEINP